MKPSFTSIDTAQVLSAPPNAPVELRGDQAKTCQLTPDGQRLRGLAPHGEHHKGVGAWKMFRETTASFPPDVLLSSSPIAFPHSPLNRSLPHCGRLTRADQTREAFRGQVDREPMKEVWSHEGCRRPPCSRLRFDLHLPITQYRTRNTSAQWLDVTVDADQA